MKRYRNLYVCSLILGLFALAFLGATSAEADASTFGSDDFNSFNLDTGLWTFVDPVGDATIMMTGTNTPDAWVSISVPGGVAHDAWAPNDAARIMQAASDTDFEVEVKFESGLSQKYQMQGVLVEQDSDDFLRFDFHSDGSSTRVYAASFTGGSPLARVNTPLTGTGVAPLYLRVKREGDWWTQSHSCDGASWATSVSFTHPLSVTALGAFVGNAGDLADGSDSPAHTGTIDYSFNTASPVEPEDGGLAVDTTPPLIYNVQDMAGQTRLRVNWSTDEPATGTVKYGETAGYELGTVHHTDFTVHHTLLITGLESATTYNFRVVSQDSSGHSGSSENFVVTTDPSGTSPNPITDIWYGPHQVFGHIGIPQTWVNVLGNVSDPDGIASLVYSLNDGLELPLSIGPDTRRLASDGDFNVDIACADLLSGCNSVVITATDTLDNTTVETVTVEYVSGNVWPATYSIDWSSVITIPDVAQIVDGLWTLETNSIRPVMLGYDRLVAIGDVSRDDYEVTVPLTIHGIDPAGYQSPSNGPAVGILMRWTGHTDNPVSGWQPKSGYLPLGAIGMYRWKNDTLGDRLQIMGNGGGIVAEDTSGRKLDYHVPYIFKMRVETIPDQGGLYSFRVWEDGQPEPSGWDLTAQEGLADPQNGSLLLLAHHVDASFGDVRIVPLVNTTATLTVTTVGSGTVAVEPDQPAYTTGQVVTLTATADPGWVFAGWSGALSGSASPATLTMIGDQVVTATFTEETSHTLTVTTVGSGTVAVEPDQPAYTTGQVVTLTATADPGWAFASWSGALSGRANPTPLTITGDGVVTATFAVSAIRSDDFNACTLDTELWTLDDPVGDATVTMTGTHTPDAWVSISVPEGVPHDAWAPNDAPRIMQPVSNTDFEVEVKFESGLSQRYQMQGLLIEQDDDDFLRFDFYSDGSNTRIYAASFANGSPLARVNSAITGTDVVPLTMRVKREGERWTQSYSYDGASWTSSVSFTHPLSVTALGTFVGNAGDLADGSDSPAHTGTIDYFFNTDSPVVPEDGDRNTLVVFTVGNGSVITEPAKSNYDCGEVVTLTAAADAGWVFAGWSGDLLSADKVVTVAMTGSRTITATFAPEECTVRVHTVGSGSVITEPVKPTYHYGDVVTFTAVPTTGWTFVEWSGDLAGSSRLTTTTITGNTAVTATFAPEAYTVRVRTVGSGSVITEPVKPTYHYGDVVTFTAVPTTGWTFVEWSGDLAGSSRLTTTTITGNTTVTATFAPEAYTVRVHTVGSGSVITEPVKPTYHYGDVVTFTAVPTTGWTFVEWSGDLAGSSRLTTTTITGNTTVTATFARRDEYTLTVNAVGGGRVDRDPDRATYRYGDVVTLTAKADPSWTFVDWSGDLSGAENPATVIISGSTTVTATFTTYPVFLPFVTAHSPDGSPGRAQRAFSPSSRVGHWPKTLALVGRFPRR